MKNNCFRHFLTVLLLLCTSAVVAHDFEVDRIYYSITGLATPTVEVSGYSQGNSVDIPETVVYEGVEYSVTRIGTSAFSGCSALTQITIPGSVKSIGESAFRGSSITSITIPEGVVEIARATFENCTGLTSISIPNSVTSVSYSSFSNTAWYNNHPDGVVYAGKVLYRYKGEMPNGTEVVIREGTVSIADKAFRYFDELVSVEIPYGVKYIGEEAFYNCSALREIGIPGSVEDMGSRAFASSNLLKVVIGDGVKRIGQSAFESCRVLSEIEIPNSVISIGDNAIVGTEWYENKPNGLVYAGKVLFEYKGDMPGGSEIVIEDGTQAIADGAFWYCDKLTKITIPNTVINIGKEAFCGCSGLVSVDIPNSVRSIGIRAFQGCNWLEEMLIGSSVASIGDSAFSGCSNLASITIPKSVTAIGKDAFKNCSKLGAIDIEDVSAWCNIDFGCYSANPLYYGKELRLDGVPVTEIAIPEGLSKINDYAFYNSKTIRNVKIPNSVTSIGDSAFFGSTALAEVEIPVSVKGIGKDAFRNCTRLENVNISDLLAWCDINFGNSYSNPLSHAKNFCLNGSSVTSLVLPSSIAVIKDFAFYGCSSIKNVIVPENITYICEDAFSGCNSIDRVINFSSLEITKGNWGNGCIAANADVVIDVSDGTVVGDFVFSTVDGVNTLAAYLGNATEIVLPEDYNGENYCIGEYVFKDCTGLTRITIPDSVTSIGNYAFYGCTGLTEVILGQNVSSIGKEAFNNCDNIKRVINFSAFFDNAYGTLYSYFKSYPAIVNAPNGEVVGDFVFSTVDGVNTLAGYLGSATEIILPEDYNGEVYGIGESVFSGRADLTSITIHGNLTSIGKSAFNNCTALTRVNISDLTAWCNVSFGDSYANPLYYAKNLYLNGEPVTELVIPDGVTEIKSYAFYNCESITSITVPYSVTNIGTNAFQGCKNLKNVLNFSSLVFTKGNSYIGGYISYYADNVVNAPNGAVAGDFVFSTVDGVNTLVAYLGDATEIVLPEDYNGECYGIGESVFSGRTDLTSITLPQNITSIGKKAFSGCTNLAHVNISDLSAWCNISFGDAYANPLYYAKNLYLNGEPVTELVIPDGVTEIKSYAFYNCESITSITVPYSVTNIGTYAFQGCKNLKKVLNFSSLIFAKRKSSYGYIAYNADNVVNAPNGAVAGDFVFSTVDGVNTLAAYLGNATEIVLPENYNGEGYGIGESVFSGRADLTNITIPRNLTSIGKSAFNNCTALTRVNISDLTAWCNVSFGDSYANPLYYAKNLYLNGEPVTELVIPDGVTEIKSYAFYNCESITSITVPYSVTNIGTNAFQGCKNLKNVLNFSSLVFTKGNSYIGGYISYYADNVVNAPNGVVIGDFIFSTVDGVNTLAAYLGNATEIVLPDNYNGEGYGIGESVFSGRSDLTSITLPACITSIGDAAFYNCSALARIDFPESLAGIGENAFYGCSSLTTLEISNNVTAIGYGAFSGCSALEVVKIDCTTVEGWFENNASIKELVIGENVAHIAGKAFSNCGGIVRVTIGKNVSQIGDKAFSSCHSLEGVYITDLSAWCNISFGGYSANPLSYAGHLYLNGKLVTDLVIPDGVTEIKDYAFYDCGSLRSVTVPGTVVCIGTGAFSSCEYLATVINFSGLIFTAYSSDHGEIANNASVVVNAVNGAVVGDFVFGKVNDVNTLLKYIGNDADVTLPEDYNGENYCIGADAFAGKQIVNIVIPGCVTAIKKDSFGHSAGSLKGVYITDLSAWCNIDFESKYANPLYYAMNLYLNGELVTELIIPDGVTEIKNYAFYNCGGVKSIVIPSCVEKVGAATFESDSYYHYYNTSLINLSNLVFSSDLNEEGSIRFHGRAIVNAPNGAIIGNNVFCTKEGVNTLVAHFVKNPVVILPDSYNGENYCIGESAFYQVEDSLRSITIPDGVIGIGAEAFRNSFELADVTLGKNVSYIGTDAFEGCIVLKNVHITDLSAWCNIDFWDASANPLYRADSLYLNGELVTDLVIPDGITEIKDYAFSGYQGLENVAIHNNVTAIGTHAFYNCLIKGVYITDLAAWCSIDFGDASANPLYNDAENEKRLLYLNGEPVTDLVIPDGVTEIKDYAFYGNNGVNSVVIPKSVAKIGELAFYCYNLSTVINLSQLVFTKGSYEEHGAIAYDADVVKNIPNAEIDGDFVFYALDGDIYFAVYLGDETEIVLPDGFQGKEYIIDELALVLSPDVESVTIPTSVIGIRNNAFGNCDMLKNLYMMNELPPRAVRSTFSDTHFESVTVYVPVGALETYRTANVWSEFWNIKEFDSTGIVEVENEDAGVTKTVYDLNGRVVENPSNGIYIINGKKVFVK